MGVGGFCVIFVVFVNFVCFNGSVVAFVIFFTALVLCSCGCVSFFDLFCGLCLCPCGVSPDVFLCLWCVCFPVCICVMNCGGPCYGLVCGVRALYVVLALV